MKQSEVTILDTLMGREDLPFLLELWRNREVMKFADELPRFRGWSRRDDADSAWSRYREKRAELSPLYVQLIVRLVDKTRMGEAFIAPLRRKIGQLRIPSGTPIVIGDIKLMPEYWSRGLGTLAMQQVVRFVFEKIDCGAYIVPPHKKNRAAVRVYQKAGFRRVRRRSPWSSHKLMKLTREQFPDQYGGRVL